MATNTNTTGFGSAIGQKVKDYKALVKFRLALSVVFSACTAYYLGTDELTFSWVNLFILGVGGFFVTGAANALNQVLEKETDKLMSRTHQRPLPAGRMEMSEAVLVAGLMGAAGILMLAYFNPLTAVLGAFSLVSYAFIYTPMKRVSPAAVWVGAVPGALPMAIGWVAATGELGIHAVFLFSLQFLWQFPHFWAIAWLSYEDYAKAGFYLLPSSQKDGRTKSSAMQIIFYTLCLVGISFVPMYLSISGFYAGLVMAICGMVFLGYAINLYMRCDRISARKLMFASLFYQLIVFIALMIDRI